MPCDWTAAPPNEIDMLRVSNSTVTSVTRHVASTSAAGVAVWRAAPHPQHVAEPPKGGMGAGTVRRRHGTFVSVFAASVGLP